MVDLQLRYSSIVWGNMINIFFFLTESLVMMANILKFKKVCGINTKNRDLNAPDMNK